MSAQVIDVRAATEKELRESKALSPKTPHELSDYINVLVTRKHDYGTCVYAMSLAAVAAYNYVAHKLGVTGFQASCADLDILRRTRKLEGPFAIVRAEDMLYPQYDIAEKVAEYLQEWEPWAADEARKEIAKCGGVNGFKTYIDDDGHEHSSQAVHPSVWARWEALAIKPGQANT